MIQPELWMLTPFVLFVSLKIPLINADDKSQRKPSDQNENYIITHYGKEFYTPVTDIESAAQHSKSGYYTAEVIPVDIHTGEELKSVKNLFVPMHTGYSIGVTDDADHNSNSAFNLLNRGKKFEVPTSQPQDEFFAKEDTKSKIPKKFVKSKYATASKKIAPHYEASGSNTATTILDDPIQQRVKKNQKRNAFRNPDDEFLNMFYDNFKTIIQQHYLGYH